MLALLKPLVLTSLKSEKFKKFVIELLEKLVEQWDINTTYTINSTTNSLSVFSQ